MGCIGVIIEKKLNRPAVLKRNCRDSGCWEGGREGLIEKGGRGRRKRETRWWSAAEHLSLRLLPLRRRGLSFTPFRIDGQGTGREKRGLCDLEFQPKSAAEFENGFLLFPCLGLRGELLQTTNFSFSFPPSPSSPKMRFTSPTLGSHMPAGRE